MKVVNVESPKDSRGFARGWLLGAALVLLWSASARAQTVQVLPEVDTYVQLNSSTQFWFQAKETREGGVPTQAEIGPSLNFFIRSLPELAKIATLGLDQSKNNLLVLSFGYRYLPQAGGAPSTNRLEPVATLQLPFKTFELSDRNRADLDWEAGTFTWRYRNRLQVERPLKAGRVRLIPYASSEFFYESVYQKWSTTEVDAGVTIPLGSKVQLTPYYQHENNTGGPRNQQVNALGGVLNLYFSVR
jgi:Protein of unknown function (DUF2490)